MPKSATQIDQENQAQLDDQQLRNPSVDFTGLPNLAAQVGAKTIPQLISEFERAGRAIMVANADANFPETPGLKLYPDPIEAVLLERAVDADLLIARKRLNEDQAAAAEQARKAAEKNAAELARINQIQQQGQQ